MVAKTCSKCGSPLQSVAYGTMLSCKHCGNMVFANDGTHGDLAEMYLRTELTNGDKLLFEQKWAEAVTCFSNLTEKYPLDIDSWMGLARAMTREQTFMALSGAEYQRLTKCLSKIQILQGALLDDSGVNIVKNTKNIAIFNAWKFKSSAKSWLVGLTVSKTVILRWLR